jgi:RimJ/RimL family protein N-acetyltransferase
MERGKGYGTAVQRLASDYLVARDETASVFAFTLRVNVGERRALEKAGFQEVGGLPNPYYRVESPELSEQPCVLATRVRSV